MNRTELCADKSLLVAYLYGECDDGARRMVEEHLATCAACAAEVVELRATRTALSEWEVPERALGFRIVSEQREAPVEAPTPVRVRRSVTLPWWLQTAAAVLLFAAAAGVAQVEVRYGPDGIVVRTGWSTKVEVPSSASTSASAPADAPWRRDLTALEQQLRSDLSASSPARATAVAASSTSQDSAERGLGAGSEDALLRRVQALISQSEQKQQRELALRLADVVRDVDVQRRADQVRVQQTFGQLEGQTGVAVQQNRELLNYLVRVSQQK